MTTDIRFGDIYTNGINYWMVVSVEKGCECDCHFRARNHTLRPVVLDENKRPAYFVGNEYPGQIKDIQPRSWLYSRGNWEGFPTKE